ncbi:MAG: hypothetical protein AAGH41_10455 [Pseudomonadota bacterium]
MAHVHTLGLQLCAAAWCLALALPFARPQDDHAVAVVFPPWFDRAAQAEAVAASGLYVASRQSPWVLVGFNPEDEASRQPVKVKGAITLISQKNFTLCNPGSSLAAGPSQVEAL